MDRVFLDHFRGENIYSMLINWDFPCPVTEQEKQMNINVYN